MAPVKVADLKNETWKKISFSKETKTKDYFISDQGRIKSIDKNSGKELVVKSTMLKTGFLKTTFRLKEGCESVYPHKLIAQEFVKPKSDKHTYVIHKDMNRRNNAKTNLKWVTSEEQRAYVKARAEKFGYHKNRVRVVGVGNYKLTEAQVAIIKKQLQTGKTRRKMIAKRFGVTTTQIKRIEKGENWAFVKAAD